MKRQRVHLVNASWKLERLRNEAEKTRAMSRLRLTCFLIASYVHVVARRISPRGTRSEAEAKLCRNWFGDVDRAAFPGTHSLPATLTQIIMRRDARRQLDAIGPCLAEQAWRRILGAEDDRVFPFLSAPFHPSSYACAVDRLSAFLPSSLRCRTHHTTILSPIDTAHNHVE